MIEFNNKNSKLVSAEEMEKIYEKIKTPKKLGAVMKWENDFTDSPTVFKHGDKYYMMFIAISKDCNISGYETHIACSDNLVDWEYLGIIMKRNNDNHWDSKSHNLFPGLSLGHIDLCKKLLKFFKHIFVHPFLLLKMVTIFILPEIHIRYKRLFENAGSRF